MQQPNLVYADGVVTTGEDEGALVLSARRGDCVRKGDFSLSAYATLWGHWQPEAFRDVRLYLCIGGQRVLEGSPGCEPSFLPVARRIAKRRRSLSGPLGIAFFNFSSVHVHLRAMLREYVRLTTVAGPEIPFHASPVVSLDAPECYAAFDAFMNALKSFADSLRFILWRILERDRGVPRSLRRLADAPLPEQLREIIGRYVDGHLAEVAEYRDNSVHYAPPGAHMAPCLLLSHNVIHAQVWLPQNPEARSLKGFRYRQKDAFTYARSLLGRTYEFCDELFPALDQVQRERIRAARKRKQQEREQRRTGPDR